MKIFIFCFFTFFLSCFVSADEVNTSQTTSEKEDLNALWEQAEPIKEYIPRWEDTTPVKEYIPRWEESSPYAWGCF